MKFNIPHQTFAEVPQKAPLRWALGYINDDTFEGQHGWWKCKDFLNDTVIYLRTGKEFSVHSYQNKAKINEDGGYVALKNVPDFFEHNLALLNEHLINKGFDPIELLHESGDGVECVILIPTMYWDNTFLISVITIIYRDCVYKKCDSWEDCVKNESTLNVYYDKVENVLKLENLELLHHTMYLNYQYNGTQPINDSYTVHNAGLQSWLNSWQYIPSLETAEV